MLEVPLLMWQTEKELFPECKNQVEAVTWICMLFYIIGSMGRVIRHAAENRAEN